jgi:type IV pilus assembly protein PilC
MPDTYQYSVRDTGGKLMSGTLVADNRDLASARLREMGLIPIKIEQQRGKTMRREISLSNRVKLKDLSVFSRQFSTMVNSGLPILKGLVILEEQTESKILARAIASVRTDVEGGASLSAAMAKHPKVFNNLYVAMVKSGEAGGVLEAVLQRIAVTLEGEVALRQRIRSAMTYPIVVAGFVTLILLAMLLFIVPQFQGLYSQLGGTLPLPTRILLAVSNALKHSFIIVILVLVAMIFGLRRFIKTKQGRELWDRFKLRVPVFGPLFQKTALARFSRVFGVMSSSGVPILQSLEVVSETVNNSLMSAAILDVQNSVKEGESISKPLARHPVFPPMVVQMLSVGEQTGSLDEMLEKISVYYDEEVKATVDSLTSLIEPIMIMFVGGAVGVSVIALYLPMFNIINLIK